MPPTGGPLSRKRLKRNSGGRSLWRTCLWFQFPVICEFAGKILALKHLNLVKTSVCIQCISDTIIRRWEMFTGKQATLAATGRCFEDLLGIRQKGETV